MWKLIELIVMGATILVFVTEFFMPLISGKPLFGSFRKREKLEKSEKSGQPEIIDRSLDEKVSITKEKVEEVKKTVKTIQNEVDEKFKSVEQLKEEADNLL